MSKRASSRRLPIPIAFLMLAASTLFAQTKEDLIGVWTVDLRLAMYGSEEIVDVLEGGTIEFLTDGTFRSTGQLFEQVVLWTPQSGFVAPIPPDGPYDDRYPGWTPPRTPPGPPALTVMLFDRSNLPLSTLSLSRVAPDLMVALYIPMVFGVQAVEAFPPPDPEPSIYVGVLRRDTRVEHLPGFE